MMLGFHSLDMNAFSVFCACLRLSAISFSVTVTPRPIQRYVGSGLYTKCIRLSGSLGFPSIKTLYSR